jgi:hypothetical protein
MRTLMVWVFVACVAAPALAQARPTQAKPWPVGPFVERGFIALNAGAQAAAPDLTYRMGFEANVEEGTVDARHPGSTGVLVEGGAGFRFRGRLGLALAASRSTRSGDASVSAEVPHPFFDDRHRHVEGQAGGVGRTETAAHLQLYYDMQSRGAWRVRVFAGPSYFSADQEIVTGVEAAEAFPFDTAEFRAATTSRAKGSGIGVNAGVDVTRMLTPRVGAGALVRYTRATLDLNAPGSRRVSTEAGGVQAGAGLRIRF